jgi:hypothetical protein
VQVIVLICPKENNELFSFRRHTKTSQLGFGFLKPYPSSGCFEVVKFQEENSVATALSLVLALISPVAPPHLGPGNP